MEISIPRISFMIRPNGETSGRDRLIATLLLVVCSVLYLWAPVRQMADSRFITAVSHSLLHEGNSSVDPSLGERAGYPFRRVGDEYYHLFPNAPALLNVPFLWLYERFGWTLYDETGRFYGPTEMRVVRTSSALVTAAIIALLFLVARSRLGVAPSLGLAVVFAFATPLLSTASRPFWSHTWGTLCLTLALWLLLARPPGRWRAVAAASALSWAVFCRPTFSLAALGLTVWLALDRRRRHDLAVLVAVGATWAALFTAYSMSVYGELVPPYFYSAQVAAGRVSVGRLFAFHPEAALGTLVSPGRGLFLFTPLFLAILVAAAWRWRRLPSRRLAVVAFVVLVAHWQVVSGFRPWWGWGGSFGHRMFTDVVPWFFVLGVLVLAAGPPAGRRRPQRLAAVLVILTLASSLFIHIQGATNRQTMRWRNLRLHTLGSVGRVDAQRAYRDLRIWNWRYPQFLAGWVAPPPIAGLALAGAALTYDAAVDTDPVDGWWSGSRQRAQDWRLDSGVTHVVPETGFAGLKGAFVFAGGGGRAASLKNLGPAVTDNDATFEVWLRPTSPISGRRVVFETGGLKTGMTLLLDESRPTLEVRDGGSATSVILAAQQPIGSDEFAQVAAVIRFESAGAELSLYINGAIAAGPLLARGISGWAGNNPSGLATNEYQPSLEADDFHGEIAILRFYRSAFMADEVAHNFDAVSVPLAERFPQGAAWFRCRRDNHPSLAAGEAIAG